MKYDADQVRVKQNAYVAGILQAPLVARAKISGATEAFQGVRGKVLALESFDQWWQWARERACRAVLELTRFAQPVRARVIGHQVREGDRPSGVRNVLASFEVDCIERHATPAPDRRRTPEAPLPVAVRRAVQPLVGNRALIEALRRRFGLQASRFQQQHTDAGARQLQGQRDTGRARADDADIGIQRFTVVQLRGVVDHVSPDRSARARQSVPQFRAAV